MYLEAKGVMHRDLKPENILIDPQTHALKLADFGSAKILNPGQASTTYICTRCAHHAARYATIRAASLRAAEQRSSSAVADALLPVSAGTTEHPSSSSTATSTQRK